MGRCFRPSPAWLSLAQCPQKASEGSGAGLDASPDQLANGFCLTNPSPVAVDEQGHGDLGSHLHTGKRGFIALSPLCLSGPRRRASRGKRFSDPGVLLDELGQCSAHAQALRGGQGLKRGFAGRVNPGLVDRLNQAFWRPEDVAPCHAILRLGLAIQPWAAASSAVSNAEVPRKRVSW